MSFKPYRESPHFVRFLNQDHDVAVQQCACPANSVFYLLEVTTIEQDDKAWGKLEGTMFGRKQYLVIIIVINYIHIDVIYGVTF